MRGKRMFMANMSYKVKGIFLILCSAVSFSAMSVFVRLSGDVPVMQKAFFRNIIAVLVTLLMLRRKKEPIHIKRNNLRYYFLRSAAGTLAIVCNFYAVDHMLLSDATMLMELSPFFIILFSYIILKEDAKLYQWIAIGVALVGSIFVIKPSAELLINPSVLVGLAAAVFNAFAYTMVRKLGMRGEEGSVIIFFFSMFSSIVLLPAVIINYEPMTGKKIILLLCAAACGCCGQFSVTAAYRFAPGREISVFDYSQLIFSSLFGWLIFGQIADAWSYIGYVIILFAGISMFVTDRYSSSNVPL